LDISKGRVGHFDDRNKEEPDRSNQIEPTPSSSTLQPNCDDDGENQVAGSVRSAYIREVLDAYRKTPGNSAKSSPGDSALAGQFFDQGIPLQTIKNALILGAGRRLLRPAEDPAPSTVRSLAYFQPLVAEVQELKTSQDYFAHIGQRIEREVQKKARGEGA
jgi:hypothetical protein